MRPPDTTLLRRRDAVAPLRRTEVAGVFHRGAPDAHRRAMLRCCAQRPSASASSAGAALADATGVRAYFTSTATVVALSSTPDKRAALEDARAGARAVLLRRTLLRCAALPFLSSTTDTLASPLPSSKVIIFFFFFVTLSLKYNKMMF